MRLFTVSAALVAFLLPQLSFAQTRGAPISAYGTLDGATPPLFLTMPFRVLGLLDTSTPDGVVAAEPVQGRLVGAGSAVWYKHKGRTASGEQFDPTLLTAAHRTLPFGARVIVRNQQNGKTVTVRINDRIGRKAARQAALIIDLSRAAAQKLDIYGRAPVAIYLVSMPHPNGAIRQQTAHPLE